MGDDTPDRKTFRFILYKTGEYFDVMAVEAMFHGDYYYLKNADGKVVCRVEAKEAAMIDATFALVAGPLRC